MHTKIRLSRKAGQPKQYDQFLVVRIIRYYHNRQVSWLKDPRGKYHLPGFPQWLFRYSHSLNTVTRSYRICTCFPFTPCRQHSTCSGTDYFSYEIFVHIIAQSLPGCNNFGEFWTKNYYRFPANNCMIKRRSISQTGGF